MLVVMCGLKVSRDRQHETKRRAVAVTAAQWRAEKLAGRGIKCSLTHCCHGGEDTSLNAGPVRLHA